VVRSFIAISIRASPELRRVLEALGNMGRAVRATSADRLHVTLRFLGSIDELQVALAEAALRAAAAGVEPFEFWLTGLGAFPRAQRPGVVWAGLRGAEPLATLVARLEHELEVRAFPASDRPWAAHLTLARVSGRPPATLTPLIQQSAAREFGHQQVTEVHLFRSELSALGARHEVMATVDLVPRRVA
jgi:RNA 2',3'-cyclic 3'-phosphodiesterase